MVCEQLTTNFQSKKRLIFQANTYRCVLLEPLFDRYSLEDGRQIGVWFGDFHLPDGLRLVLSHGREPRGAVLQHAEMHHESLLSDQPLVEQIVDALKRMLAGAGVG